MSLKQNIYLAGTIYSEEPHMSWKKKFISEIDKDFFTTWDPDPINEPHSFDIVLKDKLIISNSSILVAYINKSNME